MIRHCSNCQAVFTPSDLAREESKGMEAERKAMGLQGVLFRYYRCGHCGFEDIFVDVALLEGEAPEAFHQRRAELEAALRQIRAENTAVIVQEKQPVAG